MRVESAQRVLLCVGRQGADEVEGEEADRDHGKNASASILFYRVSARHSLYFSKTGSFVPHVVVVTRCVRGFEQRAVQSNASVAPTSQINPRKTPCQGKGFTIFVFCAARRSAADLCVFRIVSGETTFELAVAANSISCSHPSPDHN